MSKKETPGDILDETIVVDAGPIETNAEEDGDKEEYGKNRATPAQEKLKVELTKIELTIANLKEAKALNTHEETACSLTTRIKQLETTRDSIQKQIKLKQQHVKVQQKAKIKKKETLEKITKYFPEIATQLKTKQTTGRLRIESDQPMLLKDVLDIPTIGAACSEKRRDDLFRTVKTLDDLKEAIDQLGYKLNRISLYYRLLPKNASIIEGKRHVKTVPVRLVR